MRVPFHVDGIEVGSVARAHLAVLAAHADCVRVEADAVHWLDESAGEARDRRFAELHRTLRATGLIRAWRDEDFALLDPATLQVLARIERAAARFWGTLTLGAHANGVVRDEAGRVSHLWIAQRAADKATDPGLFDNLVGGGVALGQTPAQALVREAWEEAGLQPAEALPARPGSVLCLQRGIPEGWQHEWLHAFDLELPAGRVPRNQDGEVAGFALMPVAEALALARGDQPGAAMTVDAALVTLDFGLRHGLLNDDATVALVQHHRVVRPG